MVVAATQPSMTIGLCGKEASNEAGEAQSAGCVGGGQGVPVVDYELLKEHHE